MIRHAIKMVGRNIKSYLLLSVTVTLSFALLLGYLGFTDSELYNRYKDVFAADRHLIHVWSETVGDPKFDVLERQASAVSQCAHYEEFLLYPEPDNRVYRTDEGEETCLPAPLIHCLPLHCWDIYDGETKRTVSWLDGRSHEGVHLKSGEVILEEHLFRLLGLSAEDPVWSCSVLSADHARTVYSGTFRVVGVYRDASIGEITVDRLNSRALNWTMCAYLSQTDLSPAVLPDHLWIETAHYYTDAPETVYALAQAINFAAYGGGINTPVAELQNRALEVKRTETRTKALITAVLVVLLGINLYSAFSNALNDRKFEIGVKRAIGASAFSIVRQFFLEAVLLMLGNSLLGVSLVCDLLAVYKYVYERTPDQWGVFHDWIIYLSPYSAQAFAICAVALTVGFSLIFSYLTTQVEIVQYLKEE